MKKVLMLLLLVGCATPPVILTGNTSTKSQQAQLNEIADAVEKDTDAIKGANDKLKVALPNAVEPVIIDKAATDLVGQVASLRSSVKTLKEKDDAEQKRKEADEKELITLKEKVKDLESDQTWWIYAGMIAIGAAGMAIGGGMLWFGVTPKMAIGVMVSSGILMILGITIPTYSLYIGLLGFAAIVVGIIWLMLKGKEKIEKDSAVKEELIHSVQIALEHPKEKALELFTHRHKGDVVAEVAKVKTERDLASFKS